MMRQQRFGAERPTAERDRSNHGRDHRRQRHGQQQL
jgi:hypothetical protein